MEKKIYLVRHGQGEHNVANDFSIRDSLLTPEGHTQCTRLRNTFLHHPSISIVLASPLRRAIQTAIEGFSPALVRPEVKLLLLPSAQEISAEPCDVGHEREDLEREMRILLAKEGKEGFDVKKIDYSILNNGWSRKEGTHEDSLQAVEARAVELRKWLWKRPESNIVLVSHGAFLHYLTEDWDGFDPMRGTGYKNCEYRCFTFTEDSTSEEARLVQVGKLRSKVVKPPGTHAAVITGVELN